MLQADILKSKWDDINSLIKVSNILQNHQIIRHFSYVLFFHLID